MMTGIVGSVPSEAKRNEIARRFTRMLKDREIGLFDVFFKFRHRVSANSSKHLLYNVARSGVEVLTLLLCVNVTPRVLQKKRQSVSEWLAK